MGLGPAVHIVVYKEAQLLDHRRETRGSLQMLRHVDGPVRRAVVQHFCSAYPQPPPLRFVGGSASLLN